MTEQRLRYEPLTRHPGSWVAGIYQRESEVETVACWQCGALCRVHLAPLWGICWFCETATGTDDKRFRLVHQDHQNYPKDHPIQWKVVEIT